MGKTNYKTRALNILKDIVKKYPNQLLSSHLSLALSDYTNFDGISDKELAFAFEKYLTEKELDMGFANDADVEQIIKDAKNLSIESLYDDEDEEF